MQSSTATVLDNLALYGARSADASTALAYPSDERSTQCLTAMLEAGVELCESTALEVDLDEILWGIVNVFHSKAKRIARSLGDAHSQIREDLERQDGSEIATFTLEEHQLAAEQLEERLQAFEEIRTAAAHQYRELTGNAWRPPSGSMVSRKTATASVVFARDYLRASQQRELAGKCPDGPRIGFAGNPRGDNIGLVEAALDKVRARHPNMVLIHSGYTKGDDCIARNWADRHQIPQVIVPMDFNRWGSKRAGFKRNEAMVELGLTGVVLLPGNGVTANLGQKAEEAGVNVYRVR